MRKDASSLLIPFVYFIAGATTLAGVASTFFYKEDLGLTIPQVQILGSLAVIPWSIKPIYGFFSDRFPLRGLRRRPYLMLAGLLGASGYFALATVVQGFMSAAIALIISGMGFALADVIVDGLVAERSRTQKEAGKLQSICRASLLLGALLVAYLSGVLVEWFGARRVFLITGTLPLLTVLLASCISEEPAELVKFSLRETWQKIRGAVTPPLLWGTLFLFLWRSTPTTGGAFSYYLIDELQFTPEFFGRLSLISHAAGIAGVFIFRRWLLSLRLRTLFIGIVIASIVLSLPSLGLVYRWYVWLGVTPQLFAMADTLVAGPLTEIGFLPLLVLAARLCPKGLEATMFAVLASIMNIGLALSDALGGWLSHVFDIHQATESLPANYENLHIVLWIAILSSALPLLFIRWLPETRVREEIVPSDLSPSADNGSPFPIPKSPIV